MALERLARFAQLAAEVDRLARAGTWSDAITRGRVALRYLRPALGVGGSGRVGGSAGAGELGSVVGGLIGGSVDRFVGGSTDQALVDRIATGLSLLTAPETRRDGIGLVVGLGRSVAAQFTDPVRRGGVGSLSTSMGSTLPALVGPLLPAGGPLWRLAAMAALPRLLPEQRLLLGILQHAERRVAHDEGSLEGPLQFLYRAWDLLSQNDPTDRGTADWAQLYRGWEQADGHLTRREYPAAARQIYLAHAALRRGVLAWLDIESDRIRFEADNQGQGNGFEWTRRSIRLFHDAVDLSQPNTRYLMGVLSRLLALGPWEPEQFFYPLLGPAPGGGAERVVLITTPGELWDQFGLAGSNIGIEIGPGLVPTLRDELRLLLDLPDPGQERGLHRMPIRQRSRDVRLTGRDGSLLASFDSEGRLDLAPSVSGKTEAVGLPEDLIGPGVPPFIPLHDAIVIGAGPGGIAASFELSCRGILDQVVLEAGDRPMAAIYELYPEGKPVGRAYRGHAEEPEGVIGLLDSTDVAFYRRMESFPNFAHSNIRTGERVVAIRRTGHGYLVVTEKAVYAARHVVLAAGRLHKPRALDGLEGWGAEVQSRIHPASARAVAGFTRQHVLVVGGGQTAFNMVEALLANENRVTLSYRGADFARLSDRQSAQLKGLEDSGRVTILRQSNVGEVSLNSGDRTADPAGRNLVVRFRETGLEPLTIDGIVTALGYAFDPSLLQIPGHDRLEVRGSQVVDPDGTPLPDFYPIGDFLKSRSVMVAINEGVRAARAITTSLFTP